MPTRSPCRAGCVVARPSTSTGSSPASSWLRICRPRDRRLTRGRKASTRWSCCSTGARCAASPAISFDGGGARRRTMSGYGWRSWRTVQRKWRSTIMPRLRLTGHNLGRPGPPAGNGSASPAAPGPARGRLAKRQPVLPHSDGRYALAWRRRGGPRGPPAARNVLFRWPTAGWVRGPGPWDAAVGPRGSRTQRHVVLYGPRSVLGAAVVASFLDAAWSAAGRWVLRVRLLFPTRPPLSL
jgi:hypothetical protein